MPDGTKYVPLKDIVLKDAFDEYLARIVCFCFSINPQPFVSQTNRATAETANAQATEEGLGPVLNWFKRLIDQIVQRHLGFANLEFVWIDDREMDPSAADAIDVADVKAGIRTINEVRMARGLDPLPGGDKLMVATGTGYVPVTQDGAAPPQTPAPRQRPQSAFGKYNPNHWPGGSPDHEGGRFAPKGEGGAPAEDLSADRDAPAARATATPAVAFAADKGDRSGFQEASATNEASQAHSENAQLVNRGVLAALGILYPHRDFSSAVQPYTDNFAKVTNRDTIDTAGWKSSFTLHGTALESPPLPGYPEYALKMYKDPNLGDTIAVTYVTAGDSHLMFAVPYILGKPVNAAIAGFFLMAVNESRSPK